MGIENFLKKMQAADSASKKKILVVSSAVVMAIVVYVWLMYFNTLLVGAGAPPAADAGVPAEERGSFWETMKRGGVVLYERIMGGVSRLGEMLQAPREYIVKPLK
jgi:hypothetical protein